MIEERGHRDRTYLRDDIRHPMTPIAKLHGPLTRDVVRNSQGLEAVCAIAWIRSKSLMHATRPTGQIRVCEVT
jgi:hypothetical protein